MPTTTKEAVAVMNDHQKEQAFKVKKAAMEKKYKNQITNFCVAYTVETYIGFDMLVFNAKCFAAGVTKEIIPGGGAVNVPELVKDYHELMQYVTVYKG